MPELPHGTVTFVFTDIEGSTDLLKSLGERYREVLSRHRQIVRETFSATDGIEVDTQGDAFFFVFARAREAVGAAVEVQRAHATTDWPDDAAVRVRIGLHTGEPAVHEEGYLGLDVVRAARICTMGKGGHILLSETTRALVGSTPPEGVSVFPLGERHLRGIDEPERVYELEIAGLERDEQLVARAKPGEGRAELRHRRQRRQLRGRRPRLARRRLRGADLRPHRGRPPGERNRRGRPGRQGVSESPAGPGLSLEQTARLTTHGGVRHRRFPCHESAVAVQREARHEADLPCGDLVAILARRFGV